MAIQEISLGVVANDGEGDPLREGGERINQNFTDPSNAASYEAGTKAGQISRNSDRTINSIAELGSVEGNDGARVFVIGYHPDSDIGGGNIVYDANRSKSEHNGGTVFDPDKTFPSDWSNATQISDWFTADGVGSGVYVRPNVGDLLAVDFGAAEFHANNDLVINNISTYASSLVLSNANSTPYIDLQSYKFDTSAPLVFRRGNKIKSSGAMINKVTTSTSGLPVRLARGNSVSDIMDVNAVMICDHADNSYTFHFEVVGDLNLSSDVACDYGLYAPRMALSSVNRIKATDCGQGFYTHDTFMSELHIQTVRGTKGLVFADDGSGQATGTSVTFVNCWPQQATDTGWDIYGLQYSTAINSGCDGLQSGGTAAYKFQNANITFNGMGCEGCSMDNLIRQIGGEIVITNMVVFTPAIADEFIYCSDGATLNILDIRSDVPTGVGSTNRFKLDTNSSVQGNKNVFALSGTDNIVDTSSSIQFNNGSNIVLKQSTHSQNLSSATQSTSWARVTGGGSVTNGNGISVTRLGAGDYDIAFSTTRANVNYGVSITVENSSGVLIPRWQNPTTTGLRVRVATTSNTLTDPTSFTIDITDGYS